MGKIAQYGYEELMEMLQAIEIGGRMITEEIIDAALEQLKAKRQVRKTERGVPVGFVPRSEVTRDIIEARSLNITLEELYGRRHVAMLNSFRASLTALDKEELGRMQRALAKQDERAVPLARRQYEPTIDEKLALVLRELIIHHAAASPDPGDYISTVGAKAKSYMDKVKESDSFPAMVSSLFQSKDDRDRSAELRSASEELGRDFTNRYLILTNDRRRLSIMHVLLTRVKTGQDMEKLSKNDMKTMKKFLEEELRDASVGEHDTAHLEELIGYIDDEVLYRDMVLGIIKDDVTFLYVLKEKFEEAIKSARTGIADRQPGMFTSFTEYWYPSSKVTREAQIEEGRKLLAEAQAELDNVNRMIALLYTPRYRQRTEAAIRMFNFMRKRKIEEMVREEQERELAGIPVVRLDDLL